MSHHPVLIEATELDRLRRSATPPLIVHVGDADGYARQHIPGAVFLDYADINANAPPTAGLVPDSASLSQVLSALGVDGHRHVVAYDDHNGGRAGRLLYTLEIAGHPQARMLNGGLTAWCNAGLEVQREPVTPEPGDFRVQWNDTPIATADYILEHLDDDDVVLLDVRSLDEYHGTDRKAARGGHIPGAVNMEWTLAIDEDQRMRTDDDMRAQLEGLGVTPDREIIVYCQTHHRSAHTWALLKAMGYPRVRGYPGAWSDWGNREDTPVEE